jgi:hypothetical protein
MALDVWDHLVYSPFVCVANLWLCRITGHAEDLVCRDR